MTLLPLLPGQSTDEDLLSLLEDLAAGSASPRPSQAAPPSLYESSAQRLATQLRRSVSSASASQPNDAGSGTVRRAESVGLGPRSRPGSSLGSDEELFQSSPRGESPPPSFEAEPELDTPNVTTTTPISHLEPHGVDWSGAEVTYSMSETSFMQFEGTQLQPEGDMGPSRGPSGAISVATPTQQLSRRSSASGAEVVGMTSRSQRKCLLRLCSGEEEEEGEGLEDQAVMAGKKVDLVSEEEEEEEEESFLMSQPVWDDIDPDR